MNYKEKIDLIKNDIKAIRGDDNVTLIAATKYMTIEKTKELVKAGIKDLGENRTDIFLEKYEALKDLGIKWHFFGILQTRKIRDVADKIDCLHSLDKLATAMELDKRLTHTLDCFVEVNISEEANKDGVPQNRLKAFIKSLAKCENIRIVGLMCIAKHTYDEVVIRKEFMRMKELRDEIEALNLDYAPCHELSMGMTNDYKIALECGSTCLRLGRIFLD